MSIWTEGLEQDHLSEFGELDPSTSSEDISGKTSVIIDLNDVNFP